MRIECLLLLFFNHCENKILYLKPLTSMVPRDGILNMHGTQRWNFKQAWYPGWNFKQTWYPEMEL